MLIVVCIAVFRLLRAYYRESRATDDQVLAGAVIGAALAYLTMSLSLTMLPYGPSNAFFVVILGIVAVRLDALRRGDGPNTSFEPPPAFASETCCLGCRGTSRSTRAQCGCRLIAQRTGPAHDSTTRVHCLRASGGVAIQHLAERAADERR